MRAWRRVQGNCESRSYSVAISRYDLYADTRPCSYCGIYVESIAIESNINGASNHTSRRRDTIKPWLYVAERIGDGLRQRRLTVPMHQVEVPRRPEPTRPQPRRARCLSRCQPVPVHGGDSRGEAQPVDEDPAAHLIAVERAVAVLGALRAPN